jgi:hypothetical protein
LVEEVVRLTEGRSNDGYYTPMQAAHILRLTPTRVRQLLQGGELEGERDEAGHWLIPARAVHERLERLRRESFLEAVGYDPSGVGGMQGLVEELREEVHYLREQLNSELERRSVESERYQRIVAALTQANANLTERLRELGPPPGQLAAPQGPPEAAQRTGPPDKGDVPPSTWGVMAEGPERVSWWRRLFRGRG